MVPKSAAFLIFYIIGITASSLKYGVREEWGKHTDNDEIVIVGN